MNKLFRYVNDKLSRVHQVLNENGLHHVVARICVALGVIHLFGGVTLAFDQTAFDATPKVYSWIRSVAPYEIWAGVRIIVGAILIWAGVKRKTNSARLGMLLYFVIQWVWAMSFLSFAITEGSLAGLVNTAQWLTGPVIVLILMARPIGHGHQREVS